MWGAVPSPLVIWDAWREFSKSCANYKLLSSPTPHRRLLHICFRLEKKIERKLLWKSPKSACSPSIQPCQPCPKPPALSHIHQVSLDCTWRAMTNPEISKSAANKSSKINDGIIPTFHSSMVSSPWLICATIQTNYSLPVAAWILTFLVSIFLVITLKNGSFLVKSIFFLVKYRIALIKLHPFPVQKLSSWWSSSSGRGGQFASAEVSCWSSLSSCVDCLGFPICWGKQIQGPHVFV